MIRVFVKGAVLDQITDMPYILLETEDKTRTVPVSVGPGEATSIIMALEDIRVTRPMTHDLLVHFLKSHGFKVSRLDIYGMAEKKFLAELVYKKFWKTWKIKVRPSDGLAMAVRMGTPVFIKENLLKRAVELFEKEPGDRFFDTDISHFNIRLFDNS